MDALSFRNGKFRIMAVGDPHCKLTDSEKNRLKREDYIRFQKKAVEDLKPDLVVLLGDNASADTQDELRQILLEITEPYRETETPFSFILGNHDMQRGVNTVEAQYSVYRELPFCMLPDSWSKEGDYSLNIMSGAKPALKISHVYSGDAGPEGYCSVYDFVKPGQIERLKKEIEEDNIPTLVFQHIPVMEEYELLEEHTPFRMFLDGVSGLNEQKGRYFTLKKGVKGYLGESPCSPGYNSGEFEALAETGLVKGMVFGHDHMNDFEGTVNGVRLMQCKTASFNVYGDGLMQGVRILDFDENDVGNFTTEMVRYRDYFGTDCKSVKGLTKHLPDRYSVKIDKLAAMLPYIAAAGALITVSKIIKNGRK